MARLSKQVREWVDVIGISPSAVAESLITLNRDVREIVIEEADRVIKDNLQGGSGSLVGYRADFEFADDRKVVLGGESFDLPSYNIYVRAPDWHQSFGKAFNVFDLLDSGRDELPYKPTGVYTVWSWRGRDTAGQTQLNVPQGSSGFNIRQQLAGPSFTPTRTEPRGEGQRITPAPRQLFTKGPLRAVPGRNLYKRIMTNIRRKLRQQGLPFEGVTFSSGR